MSGCLNGLGVLVTRPRERAGGLCKSLQAEGARVVLLPTLDVEALYGPALEARARELLAGSGRLLFVSTAAVETGLALFRRVGATPRRGTRVGAVGRATAAALAAAGWRVDDQPGAGAGAESLLAGALHEVAGEQVVIVRGEGGRELLSETLAARGARVAYLEVYRRVETDADPAPALAGWQEGWLQFTIVTSASGLDALLGRLNARGRGLLRRSRGIALSERLAQRMQEVGFQQRPRVAADPSDRSITEAVIRAAAEQRERP